MSELGPSFRNTLCVVLCGLSSSQGGFWLHDFAVALLFCPFDISLSCEHGNVVGSRNIYFLKRPIVPESVIQATRMFWLNHTMSANARSTRSYINKQKRALDC